MLVWQKLWFCVYPPVSVCQSYTNIAKCRITQIQFCDARDLGEIRMG